MSNGSRFTSSSTETPLATLNSFLREEGRGRRPDGFLLDRWEAIQDELFAIVEPKCVPPGRRAAHRPRVPVHGLCAADAGLYVSLWTGVGRVLPSSAMMLSNIVAQTPRGSP